MKTIVPNKTYSLILVSLLFCTFYTAPLFSYCPIRFSDIGCAILLYLSYKQYPKIKTSNNSKVALALIIWGIIDGVILLQNPYFSIINHITQLIRLTFAVLTFCYLPNLLRNINIIKVYAIIKTVILIHVWIQIIYFILYHIGFSMLFNVLKSYEDRTEIAQHNYLFFNHFILVNIASGYPRFSGLFEEPAWFGWTLNLLVALVLQFQILYKIPIFTKKDLLTIILAFSFTFSFSSLFSLILIFTLYYIVKKKLNLLQICIFCIVGVSFLIAFIYISNESFYLRFLNIIDGSDGSSNSRLIGSWNSFITTLYNDPWFGYGLGDDNKTTYFKNLSDNNILGISIGGTPILDMHNMLFQITGNLGLLGGLLFISLLRGLSFKRTPIILISFILTFFSVNVYNNYFYFIALAIAIYSFKLHTTKHKSYDSQNNTLLLVK